MKPQDIMLIVMQFAAITWTGRCVSLDGGAGAVLSNGLPVGLVGDILNGGPGHLYPPQNKGWRVKRKIVNRGGYYILQTRKSWGSGPWTTSGSASPWASLNGQQHHRRDTPSYPSRWSSDDVPLGGTQPHRSHGEDIRKRVDRNLKREIAEYAVKHGLQSAQIHYAEELGRPLRDHIILKFIRQTKKRRERIDDINS